MQRSACFLEKWKIKADEAKVNADIYLDMMADFLDTGLPPSTKQYILSGKPWQQDDDIIMKALNEQMKSDYIKVMVMSNDLYAEIFTDITMKFVIEYLLFQGGGINGKKDDAEQVDNKEDVDGKGMPGQDNLEALDGKEIYVSKLDQEESEDIVYKKRQLAYQYLEKTKEILEGTQMMLFKKEATEEEIKHAWGMGGISSMADFRKEVYSCDITDLYPVIDEIVQKMGRSDDGDGSEYSVTEIGKEIRIEHSQRSDIEGIAIGNDISSILPRELVEYAVPETENLFLYKYVTNNLQIFRHKSESPVSHDIEKEVEYGEKGPMIVCIDTSGSMYGKPEKIAVATMKRIADIADKEQRDCYLINFSCGIQTIDLSKAKRRDKIKDVLKNPSMDIIVNTDNAFDTRGYLSGGTDVTLTLKEIYRLIDEGDYFETADVLWISDFQIPYPDYRILEKMEDTIKQGTRFFGLRVGWSAEKLRWEHLFEEIVDINV